MAEAELRRRSKVTAPTRTARSTLPSAEELGTRSVALLQRSINRVKARASNFAHTCQVWAGEARRGLTDIVEIKSVLPEESALVRHRRVESATQPRQRYVTAAADDAGQARGSVKLLDRSQTPHDYLLEVSVLESLGFYDPNTSVAVTLDTSPNLPPATPSSAPVSQLETSPIEPGLTSQPGRKSLIPDIDLTNWKPHVIARSKLGGGRLSSSLIVALSITLVVLVALVLGLVRAPGREALQEGQQVATEVRDLTVALTGLDPILADATTDVAEATPLLIAVDTSARELFDAASQLGDDLEQQVLRQSAASIAQRALDLESLVGDSLSYRLVLNPLWRSPDLAGLVDPTQAAAAIATWQAQLGDMIEALPMTPELATHVEQVRGFIQSLETWRTAYMDALSADDMTGADAAVADLEGQLALLAQSGEETLTEIFADAGAERRRLLADLASIAS